MDRTEHNAIRTGRLTSGCAHTIMHGGYNAWNSLAQSLRNPRPISDQPHPNMPAPLRWGLTHEPTARALFWDEHPEFEECTEKAWLHHHDETSWLYPYVGTSPDLVCYGPTHLLVTGVEIKCPWSQAEFARKLKDIRPTSDKAQVQWHIWIAGVEEWYYVLFDPRTPTYNETVWPRDNRYIDQMEEKARIFLEGFQSSEPFKAHAVSAADIMTKL